MEALNIKKKFEEVYEEEVDSLFRYCTLRVGSKAQAKDIVQDVFVELWQAYNKGDEIKNPRAFLFTILRHRIIDWYRKKKTLSLESIMRTGDGEHHFEPPSRESGEAIMLSVEVRQAIEAINSLPSNYREAVYLRVVEDLSPPQIAQILNTNANIVSIRINRGLKKLKEKWNIEDLL